MRSHILGPIDIHALDWSRFLHRPLFTLSRCDEDTSLTGKTILITGAGGSIGSSLALQLMGGLARTLILLDHSAHNLKALFRKHRQRNITLPEVEFVQADILRDDFLEETFSRYRPDIVFHSAAVKDLVVLESDPFAALQNNVLGTLRLLQCVDDSSAECFINVSTDKAVNPTSVLGVSKRIAELLVLAVDSPVPRKLSLRLGNVLASSGSVVPLFQQSIENHRPLKITDREASRYFVTLEETSAFLLESLRIASNSLLLPEMGTARKIIDLANFMLNELEGPDWPAALTFTGLRDGEKCSEDMTYDYEYLENTVVPQIYDIRGNTIQDPESFADSVGRLLQMAIDCQKTGFVDTLTEIVPEFKPSPTLLRYLS